MHSAFLRGAAPLALSVVAIAFLAVPGQAQAVTPAACPPLTTPFDTALTGEGARLQSIRETLDGGAVLLGHRGERVPAPLALFVLSDPDPEPRFWPDAVDWSPYTLADGTKASIVFERDAAGAICRILQSVPMRGERADVGGYRLAYDAQGRLSGYVQYTTGRWKPAGVERQACVDRNQAGAITALHETGCVVPAGQVAAAKPAQSVYFVRDAQGRILRRIDLRAGVEGAQVHRYGANGSVVRLRAQPTFDNTLLAYAEPASSKERLWVLQTGAVPPLNIEIGDQPWRVVRIPAEVLALPDEASWDPDTHTLLFEGKTNADGELVLSAPQQAQLREALRQTPGQIMVYTDPMTRFQAVQALAADTWRACVDPAQARADACD